MERDTAVQRLSETLSVDPDVVALLLAGSMGREDADEFSDIDLVAVVRPDAVARVAGRWPEVRGVAGPLAYDQRVGAGTNVLYNQITVDWIRYDLVVCTEETLGRRSRGTVFPLFDRGGVYDRLPERLPPVPPSAAVAQRIVPEFFRVLALVSVVLGREDYVVGASGSALLRTMLIQAMTELVAAEDRGGALHLSRLLPADRYAVVADVPAIEATRTSVVNVHRYLAQHFLPVGRELCARTGIDWPTDFVDHVARFTEPELGIWFS